MDKDTLNYLINDYKEQNAQRQKEFDEHIDKQVSEKRYVGTPEMIEQAKQSERERIRTKEQPDFDRKTQILSSEMFQDAGGSYEAAQKKLEIMNTLDRSAEEQKQKAAQVQKDQTDARRQQEEANQRTQDDQKKESEKRLADKKRSEEEKVNTQEQQKQKDKEAERQRLKEQFQRQAAQQQRDRGR